MELTQAQKEKWPTSLRDLFNRIKHGEEDHQQWLCNEMDSFINATFGTDSIGELCEEGMRELQILAPPEEYGEDLTACRIYDIFQEIQIRFGNRPAEKGRLVTDEMINEKFPVQKGLTSFTNSMNEAKVEAAKWLRDQYENKGI